MNQQQNLRRSRRRKTSSSCIVSSSSQSSVFAINDKLSNLPDPILHDIFKFLSRKCIARTSVVSNQFNSLRRNYPIIDIDEVDHRPQPCKKEFMKQMKNCLEKNDFTYIEKLRIGTREPMKNIFRKNISSLVDKFIVKASSSNRTLKEIDLKFRKSKIPPLPRDMFQPDKIRRRFYLVPEIPIFAVCKSLKVLKLEGCLLEGAIVMMGDGIIFPFLHTLHLKNCLIPDPNFTEKLIDGCPKLEKLSHKFIMPGELIKFSSSTIKTLVLASYFCHMVPQIITPNLKTLKISGINWMTGVCGPIFLKRYIPLSATNIEILILKGIMVSKEGLKTATSSTLTNLKELHFDGCLFVHRGVEFESATIQQMTFSKCKFSDNYLKVCKSTMPLIENVIVDECRAIAHQRLALAGDRSLYAIRECLNFSQLYEFCFL